MIDLFSLYSMQISRLEGKRKRSYQTYRFDQIFRKEEKLFFSVSLPTETSPTDKNEKFFFSKDSQIAQRVHNG